MNNIQIIKEDQNLDWDEIALECPKCGEIYKMEPVSCSFCLHERIRESSDLKILNEELIKCLKEALQEKLTWKDTAKILIQSSTNANSAKHT